MAKKENKKRAIVLMIMSTSNGATEYANIKFNSIEDLIKKADKAINETSFKKVEATIRDEQEVLTKKEIVVLEENEFMVE